MASRVGESPHETVSKILMWCEVMYKIVVGGSGITKDSRIGNVPVSYNGCQLGSFFDFGTEPSDDDNLWRLLTCNTKYREVHFQARALGSLFHIIQDSFARGHTQRKLLNPNDLEPGTGK